MILEKLWTLGVNASCPQLARDTQLRPRAAPRWVRVLRLAIALRLLFAQQHLIIDNDSPAIPTSCFTWQRLVMMPLLGETRPDNVI